VRIKGDIAPIGLICGKRFLPFYLVCLDWRLLLLNFLRIAQQKFIALFSLYVQTRLRRVLLVIATSADHY